MNDTDIKEAALSQDLSPDHAVREVLPESLRNYEDRAPYKRLRLQFIAAVAAQLLILTGLAATKAYTFAYGTTVTLQTVPVDPRDMFRGDYVSLNYVISTVPTAQSFNPGDEVYVVLKKGTPYWTAETAVAKADQVPPSAVAIKGKVQWQEPWQKSHTQSKLHLHYGIEQAFVPEGSGHDLEKQKHLMVQVAVDHAGNSVVKNVKSE